MSNTAVIISGVLRELDNALPSWQFAGDLHLYTQRQYQPARTTTAQHDITGTLSEYSDKFTSITIVNQLTNTHPSVNMAWKWLVAYNQLQPYIQEFGYTRFIITRPDLYFVNYADIQQLDFKSDTVYTTSEIVTDSLGYEFFNDIWIAGDISVFKMLSGFYQYYLPLCDSQNVHQALSSYIRHCGLRIDPALANYAQTIPLRPTHRTMLNKGILLDKYTVNDLFTEGSLWNNQTGYLKD
jgi:hypothetical protein